MATRIRANMYTRPGDAVAVTVKRKDAVHLAIMILRDLTIEGRALEYERRARYQQDKKEVYANKPSQHEAINEMSRRKLQMHAEQWPRRLDLARMFFRVLSLDLVGDLGLQQNHAQKTIRFEEKLATFAESLNQYIIEARLFNERLESFTEERVADMWCRVLEQAGLDAVKKASGGRATPTRPAGGRPSRGKQHEVRVRHASEITPDIPEDADNGESEN